MALSREFARIQSMIFSIVFRAIVIVNSVLFALSCKTGWEQSSNGGPGTADAIYGRYGGFRADFLWLALTSLVIVFFGMQSFFGIRRREPGARINTVIAGLYSIAFAAYIWHLLTKGVLYFG